ncbi:MAG TPA: signal peptide peptidase SppA [Pyrinomonadaceae bacterium]|nr:signal peptide peptidase SppA [Pyrinomonadaceae bacterium]
MAMSTTRKVVLTISGILIGLVLIIVVGFAILVSLVRGSRPSIRDNSVLALRVSGPLPDYVPDDPFRRLFGSQPQSLSSLLAQFRKAKVDKRITAVILDIDGSDAGWAKAEEIRGAIEDFRTSGKPVYGYMETAFNKDYYIATACDKVFVPPPGELFTIGLAADVMFFRGSLDKLGVYPDMYQIGKYKSAGDMFTQKEMTPAHREFINSLLDDLYGRYVEGIAKARNKTPDEVKKLIDNAPYTAAQAKDAGLIDGAAYRDEVEKELKKRLGYGANDELHLVQASEYRQISQESLGLNKGERVAVVYAAGDIVSGKSSFGGSGEETIGSDSLVRTLNEVRNDTTIKAVVLRIDSPGGSGLASDIIWRAIESLKEKKPVVVSMSDVAASGGYYIACNANKIVAEPSTITGSIGVVGGKPVIKGFYDWIGVSNEYVLRGANAGMFRESEKFSDTERKKFEELIKNTYYDQFLPKVAKGRGKNAEYIDSIGQGRVWTGRQGKDNGLVDEYGGLDKAIEIAKQLAKIPADKSVQRVIRPQPPGFFEQLMSSGGEDDSEQTSAEVKKQAALVAALPEDMRRTLRYMQVMDRAKHGEAIYMMPFDLRIR